MTMDKFKPILVLIAVVLLFYAAYQLYFSESSMEATITEVQAMQTISSTEEGRMVTHNYWMVFTDRGAFRIEQTGFFSNAGLVYSLEKGQRYRLQLRGLSNDFFGLYPTIESAHKIDNN